MFKSIFGVTLAGAILMAAAPALAQNTCSGFYLQCVGPCRGIHECASHCVAQRNICMKTGVWNAVGSNKSNIQRK
jgi:hypothetical protein